MRKTKEPKKGLRWKDLRGIERKFKIFLDDPENPQRGMNEQYGVFDMSEEHIGDIYAKGENFTREELIEKIEALLKK